MTVLPLVLWPDPRLERVCEPLAAVDDRLRTLAVDMLDTMYEAKGRGLAAPQVGVLERLFVMDATWKDGTPEPFVMINPTIMARDAKRAVITEICLSIPGLEIAVDRPAAVTMQWTSETGEIHMNDFDGAEARIIQHEMDHLNGIVTLAHLEEDARAAALAEYRP
ncbi:MAG: peptide deformylase [Pseudomonadota bacterium]